MKDDYEMTNIIEGVNKPLHGAFGPSVDLTYPPLWKLQYTSASTNVAHTWQCVLIFYTNFRGGGGGGVHLSLNRKDPFNFSLFCHIVIMMGMILWNGDSLLRKCIILFA